MVDISRRLTFDDFWRWNRAWHNRQIQAKYDELTSSASNNQVSVAEEMKTQGFDSWGAFAANCPTFPLSSRPMDLSELGSGTVLYFYFLRFMMAVLLLFSAMQVPALIIYGTSGNLEEWGDPANWGEQWRGDEWRGDGQQAISELEPNVTMSWLSTLSPGSLGPQGGTPGAVPWFYVLSMWMLAVLVVFQQALQININEEVDLDSSAPDDFAVLVEGLPANAVEESVVKDFFRRNAICGRDDVEVVNVVMGWDVREFDKKIQELKTSGAALKKIGKTHGMDGEPARELEAKMKAVEMSLKLQDGAKLKSTGIAVVVFRLQSDQCQCLERWSGWIAHWFNRAPGSGGLCSFGTALPLFPVAGRPLYRLRVSRAPNPSDINWRDVGRTTSERVVRRAATVAAMTFLLAISYIAVYVLTLTGRQASGIGAESMAKDPGKILNFGPALGITIINVLLMLAARFFGEREYHLTKTDASASMTTTMLVAMVLNSAIVLYNAYREPHEWYRSNGLLPAMYSMLAVNFFCPPFMFLLDYEFALNWVQRRRLTHRKLEELNSSLERSRGSEEDFRQAAEKVKQLQVCFEPTLMDVPRHYANAEKTFFCCVLYMPLMPPATLIGLASLVFQYHVDKWMLLRYNRRHLVVQNANAARQALSHVQHVVLFGLPFSFLLFLQPSWSQRGQLFSALMFALLPAVVLILVPKRYLASKLQFMTKWVLPQSDNHRASARSRGGLADQTQQDYYQAQYMWPKELKYHKSHFVYALLPEEQNPENLEPGSAAEVQAALAHYGVFLADVAAVKGGSQRWRRRSYHGPRDAAGTGAVMPYAQPKALDGLQTAVGISGRVRAPAAVVPSCQLLPTTIGAGSKTGHAVSWEFENATGFEAFDAGCQKEVERHFQEWQSGGPARVKVSARVVVISVDFKKMTSLVDGSSRVRKIRRVRFSD